MNLLPINQTKLFGFSKQFNELVNLFKNNKFPNKILFSGLRGIGKSTLSYHIINYIFSLNEDYPYDLINFKINENNKSFKLILNSSHPNFYLIDILEQKNSIDISQIRDLISKLNKTSFNTKPRIVLIDNIENLNTSSINALLKIIEEPNDNINFILINNNIKILSTLKSRCLEFKISFSHEEIINICNELLNENIFSLINKDLLNYYITPGDIYKLINFSIENEINLKESNLNVFLEFIIDKGLYKKEKFIKNYIYEFIELYFRNKSNLKHYKSYYDFLYKISNMKKFNLDDESLFLEFKYEILNG